MALHENIRIDMLSEEEFSVEDFSRKISEDFNRSGLLISGISKNGTCSDGTFEADLWVFDEEIQKNYIYLDFEEVSVLRFKKISDNDMLLIKCWLAELILDEDVKDGIRVKSRLTNLCDFISETNNFSEEFLMNNKGNNMDFLKTGMNGEEFAVRTVYEKVGNIIEYVNYREDIGCGVNPNTVDEYMSGLKILRQSLELTRSVRSIPKNRDALKFGFYLETFFKNEEILKELKLFYMPLLIWWKISTVIPIRPSEMCTKMLRDCLINNKGKYYIKINRVKVKTKQASLPVLKKIELSKEIHDLIETYINLTNEYGKSETLFSYRALSALRVYLIDLDYTKYSSGQALFVKYANEKQKIDFDYFTPQILRTLLKSFYNNIIENYYEDNSIEEKLCLHDTRHYAFTSLLLQGLTPVEIALIGGHTNLMSYDSYTCNTTYYVDHEVVKFVEKQEMGGKFSNTFLKDIIFKKCKVCPNSEGNCVKTDDGIGCCTLDINDDTLCENEEFCFKCQKWWCEPTEDNYVLLKQYIEGRCFEIEEEFISDEKIIMDLISNVKMLNLDGELREDINDARDVKVATMELGRKANELIDLKKILLDLPSAKKIQ